MAKLIITLDGAQVGEVAVDKERITIGRRPENDIQLDHIAVSSQHAAIVSILNDSFLEDLGSTNGTVVNGGAVHKHFLRNGDLIEIGRHRMRYIGDVTATRATSDFEKTMVLNRPTAAATPPVQTTPVATLFAKTPAAAFSSVPASGAAPTPTSAWQAAGSAHDVALAEAGEGPVLARTNALRAMTSTVAEAEHAPLVDAETAVAALLAEATASETVASEPVAPEAVPLETGPEHASLADVSASDVPPVAAMTAGPPVAVALAEAAPAAAASVAMHRKSASKPAVAAHAPLAFLQVLNGTGAGRVLEINKPLTTIGRETVQVAVISRRSSGYFVAQVDGDEPARLNNAPLPANAIALHVHDILEIAGIKLEFFFQD